MAPAGEVTAIVGPNGSGKSTFGCTWWPTRTDRPFGDGGRARRLRDGRQGPGATIGLRSQRHDSIDAITVEDLVTHGRYQCRGFMEPIDDADRRPVDRPFETRASLRSGTGRWNRCPAGRRNSLGSR
jgi:iron complex transport system ATP-binding protein